MEQSNEVNDIKTDAVKPISPNTTKKPVTIILFGIFAVFLSIAGFLLGKYTNIQQQSTQTEISEPTPKKLDVVEVQRQQNKEKAQKTAEDTDAFRSSTLLQHPELQQILQNTEIQVVNKFTISSSNTDAWVIDAIDKSYLEGNQTGTDMPRHQYIVTSSYWKDMQGPLAVECLTSKVFPVTMYNDTEQKSETINLLVDWSCSVAAYVSLFNLRDGNKIPLSDPKNLVPSGNSWIVNEEGNSSGKMEPAVFGKKPIFLVNYGHAEPFGMGMFSAETGRLLQLTLYEQFTQ